MEQLTGQVRTLIYTVICFQCLLQLTQGSVYQKYLKFFVYLLTLSICCRILLGFTGQLSKDWHEADVIFEEWMQEWMDTETPAEEELSEYNHVLKEQITKQAQEEYDRREQENAADSETGKAVSRESQKGR